MTCFEFFYPHCEPRIYSVHSLWSYDQAVDSTISRLQENLFLKNNSALQFPGFITIDMNIHPALDLRKQPDSLLLTTRYVAKVKKH